MNLKKSLSGFGKLMQSIGTILSFVTFIVFLILVIKKGWDTLTTTWAIAVLIFSAIPTFLSFPITLMKLVLLIIGKKPVDEPEKTENNTAVPCVEDKQDNSKGILLSDILDK